jgi:hypothetical protein
MDGVRHIRRIVLYCLLASLAVVAATALARPALAPRARDVQWTRGISESNRRGSVLLGDQSIESSARHTPGGSAEAFSFVDRISGTARSISVYVDRGNQAGTLIAGLYSDRRGHPGSLAGAGYVTSPRSGAWNTVALRRTPTVSAGTTYWIAVTGRKGTLDFRERRRRLANGGSCRSEISRQTGLTWLPSSWRRGPQGSRCPISANVRGTPSGPPVSPPVSTAKPVVSGPPTQGGTLTTTNGSWNNGATGYAYGWQDCDASGNNCTSISGASTASYTLAAGDVGDTVRAVVTATNAGGSTSASSDPTGMVAASAPAAPVNTANPAVTGTATQGQTLSTSNGSWSTSPTGYAYAWQDCDTSGNNCSPITGATASSYTLAATDVGDTIRAVVTATNAGGSTSAISNPTVVVTAASTPPPSDEFPLTVSANGRYLQTAVGSPFLMVGDSPQSLIGDNSVSTADSFLDDRAAHGFNTVWINLLCASYTFCPADGKSYNDSNSTADNLAPFTTGSNPSTYDVSTPNDAYFSRAAQIIAHAQSDGIEVLLDPIETGGCTGGGWITTIENNGDGNASSTTSKDYHFGQYLGTWATSNDLKNIIWLAGNDFYCVTTPTDNNDVLSIMNGLKNTNPTALQSMEPKGSPDKSSDYSPWSTTINLDLAYSYAPSYGEDIAAYNASPPHPTFLGEANYDGEHLQDGCNVPSQSVSAKFCRLQEWWTMTSGATGQLYGSYFTDAIGCGSSCNGHSGGTGDIPANGFNTSDVDDVPVAELGYETKLLQSIAWQNLVPDTTNTLVTSPLNNATNCPTSGSMAAVSCVTDAETPDKTLGLIYDPTGSNITVNLAQMEAGVSTNARWYDPTHGTYSAAGSFADTGSHTFTTPGANSAGDSDWVLLLEAGGFGIQGTSIKAPDGSTFVPVGANMDGQDVWWNAPTAGTCPTQGGSCLRYVQAWGWNTLRLSSCLPGGCPASLTGCGASCDYFPAPALDNIINTYTRAHIVTMVELHDYTNPNYSSSPDQDVSADPTTDPRVMNFWVNMAQKYKNDPYVWFNILNEPLGLPASTQPQRTADYFHVYEPYVKAIRAQGADNIIVLDGCCSAQDSESFSCPNSNYKTYSDNINVAPAMEAKYGNILPSVHVYNEWGASGSPCSQTTLETAFVGYMTAVHNAGVPLIVGEGGDKNHCNASTVTWGPGQCAAVLVAEDCAHTQGVGFLWWGAQMQMPPVVGAGFDGITSPTHPTNLTTANMPGWDVGNGLGKELWGLGHGRYQPCLG